MRRLPPEVRALPERVKAAAALESLTPRERAVLAMLLLEGLSPLEAAGALGTTSRQVERLYAAALYSFSRQVDGERKAS